MNHYLAGSWLFLMGSLAFTLDALIGIFDATSTRSILYLLGCLLFLVGCVYFVLDARKGAQGKRDLRSIS